ncbi:hypothetical protein CASFOL_010306 [Castilleja foliolosa]|uniref:Uncharacterized protein n=1 Tax=Castilleja foliolosa TaxID=1961234 RepID=A0ABD3DS69_9LAMI
MALAAKIEGAIRGRVKVETLPRSFRCIESINDDDSTFLRALDLPAGFRSNLVVPCDGLILLIIDWDKMFLANPITLEQAATVLMAEEHKLYVFCHTTSALKKRYATDFLRRK